MQVCLEGALRWHASLHMPQKLVLLVQGQATDDDLSNTDLMDEMSRLQDNSDGAQLQMEREETEQAGHGCLHAQGRSQKPQAASAPSSDACLGLDFQSRAYYADQTPLCIEPGNDAALVSLAQPWQQLGVYSRSRLLKFCMKCSHTSR